MVEHDFCEYAVVRKKEGGYLAAMICAVLCGALALVGIFLFLSKVGGAFVFLGISLLVLLFWYLSRYTFIEYEYTQTGAVFDGAAVYDRRYRKEKVSVDLKAQARSIAPYHGKFEGGFSPRRVLDLRSGRDSSCGYAIVYETDGEVRAVLFDATARMIENLYYAVPSVTVRADGLPD